MEEFIRVKPAARRLSVSVKLVYKLVDRGELLAVRVGRAVCILTASLEAYIAAHKTALPITEAAAPVTPPPRQSSEFVFLPRRSRA